MCPIDASKLDVIRKATESFRAGSSKDEVCYKSKKWLFHVEKPSWGKTDIRWISSKDEHTFRTCFEPLFEKLRVAELFRFLGGAGGLTLFSGFIVARQHTAKSNFHTDFLDTGAKCFTMMTPLYDMSALEDCHLLCVVDCDDQRGGGSDEAAGPAASEAEAEGAAASVVDLVGTDDSGAAAEAEEESYDASSAAPSAINANASRAKQYRYSVGEAIAFGDGFIHATETGSAPRPLAFLCFTFGWRQCTEAEWANAVGYIAEQGPVYQDPWGRLVNQAANN